MSWSFVFFLAPIVRPVLKVVGFVLLAGLGLTVLQIFVAAPVAALEVYAGVAVPGDAFPALCMIGLGCVLVVYGQLKHRRRASE